MFIHTSPKKVNKASDMTIHAVFEYQGVKYEERYKTMSLFLTAVRRTKRSVFVNAVDLKNFNCIYPHHLPKLMERKVS